MPQVDVGVVTQAQLNAGMNGVNGGRNGLFTASPASWAFIWFGISVAFILFVYFGFGGLRGSVAS